MTNLHLHNVDILEKFLKDYALNKIYIAEKDEFEILICPYVTFDNLWGQNIFNKKNASWNVSIKRIFIKIGT